MTLIHKEGAPKLYVNGRLGEGRIGAGEGVVGLSWAFLVAGASTTVVSQWKVDSASTAAS